MKRIALSLILVLCVYVSYAQSLFPDGTPISGWFKEDARPNHGKRYVITDYGVLSDSTVLQTDAIQKIIDKAYQEGGGTIVIPEGTFLSGSLFFRPGTGLHLDEGAVLKGSDYISDFALVDSRMEGQCIKYFAALVNADGVDGFHLTGQGTINGNGERYWRSFWLRREYNPDCTNLEEMRPRILYVSNSKDVHIEGVRLENSPFWTSHFYKCERVRIWNVSYYAPAHPVPAPSSDAIDIDVCSDVHVKGCSISVNDDAIALKGGKGPWADQDECNGSNQRVIIEDCNIGFCHSALTCGSESIHNRNIIFRNTTLDKAACLLRFKMRPDTPQNYEYIHLEGLKGHVDIFLHVFSWTQFFDLKGRQDPPKSYASNLTMKDIRMKCGSFFVASDAPGVFELSDFIFDGLEIQADDSSCDKSLVRNFKINNVRFY